MNDRVVTGRTCKMEELRIILDNKPQAPALQDIIGSLMVYTQDFDDLFNNRSSTVSELTENPTSGNPDKELIKMFINEDNTQ